MSDTNEKLGDIIADLNSYIASLPKPEKPKRKQQSVEYINEFINDYLDSEPKPSKTGAMKAYRDAGNACEQKKFHGYYQEQINKR
ncbi:hypothetical protein JCM19239_6806 [Vibrio variabilis]|uniref:Uncharacterized protein n=1 Tax=Vibrio variabilis TaxID=990271 RepID=A0ABQ0JN32_9VIBR|nr:hypothetical protein JCM19239_6806 [Vibrio variabilis]